MAYLSSHLLFILRLDFVFKIDQDSGFVFAKQAIIIRMIIFREDHLIYEIIFLVNLSTIRVACPKLNLFVIFSSTLLNIW